MNRFTTNGRWLSAGMAVLGLMLGATSSARADFAYAYAQQAVNNINVSILAGTLTPGTTMTDTTSQAGFQVGVSQTSPLDAPQVFAGSPSMPAENFFGQVAKFATTPPAVGAQPTSPAADFAHGDVQITNIGSLYTATGASVNNVAESYLTAGVNPNASGSGTWTISTQFTVSGLTSPTSLTIKYNYANQLFDSAAGPGASGQSNYKVDIDLFNSGGTKVFTDQPPELNHNLSSNGPFTSSSGTITIASGTILANGLYTLTFSGGEFASSLISVPEPAGVVLMGLGLLTVGGLGYVRRRTHPAD